MERDIRETALYLEIEDHFKKVYEPGFGKITGASNPAPSPDGRTVAFTGSRLEKLEGSGSTRVCLVDVESGSMDEITRGPNDDRLPQWSPDGSRLAFLSDRAQKGQFQLFLLEAGRLGEAIGTPRVEGNVEYFRWSPDGTSILLGVAAPGADLAGVQGSGTTESAEKDLPSWMPSVDSGAGENQFRRLQLYDIDSKETRALSRHDLNIWEAAWAGSDTVAAIVSDDPGEDAWYTARLALIAVPSGADRTLYRSDWQLGVPAGSPSGRRLAVIEALCSDRGAVAGDMLIFDLPAGTPSKVDTLGVDVTHLAWRDDNQLLFAGIRGLHTVAGELDATTGQVSELWDTLEWCGVGHPEAWPIGRDDFVAVIQSYQRHPEVAVVQDGVVKPLTSLAHEGSAYLKSVAGRMEEVGWTAPDGLEIGGLLVTPKGVGPHPLAVNIHGGPVSAVRNRWPEASIVSLLASRGYAVLQPNPRGSVGRGQAFARLVMGDLGGAETRDHLSGIDALIERGVADPTRIGVTGASHGGYMSAWIITQSNRFAAAVVAHPVTNLLSQHVTSNIGAFDRWFLQDDPSNPGGKYFSRSPVMFARNAQTPALVVAGGQDRCTPPGQAVEFHRALLENGVESALAIYPEEGHGIRKFPALIDYCTRALDWFERHMPATAGEAEKPAAELART